MRTRARLAFLLALAVGIAGSGTFVSAQSLQQQNDQILQELKGLGIRMAVDDFGTGYSSLAHLKSFPLDVLKIDRSFVRNVSEDPEDAAIVLAIIAMAHSLGLSVVAEGVENEEQYAFLKTNSCDEIQGYLFSEPVSATEYARFIETSESLPWRITDA